MTAIKRSRRDPRADATRSALINAAERLFADAGVEGVSLRQIGAEIGSSNSNVVAYYFGTRDGLISAIFEHRMIDLEAHRAGLLRSIHSNALSGDMAALLQALFRPIFSCTDDQGRHSYAAFLSTVSRANRMDIRIALGAQFPATEELVELVRRASGVKDVATFRNRLQICLSMASTATQLADQAASANDETLFNDTIEMMRAALTAPVRTVKKRSKP